MGTKIYTGNITAHFDELGNNEVIMLEYHGDGDPVLELEKETAEYKKEGYIEFIDSNMDNPWIVLLLKKFDYDNDELKSQIKSLEEKKIKAIQDENYEMAARYRSEEKHLLDLLPKSERKDYKFNNVVIALMDREIEVLRMYNFDEEINIEEIDLSKEWIISDLVSKGVLCKTMVSGTTYFQGTIIYRQLNL